MTPSPPRRELGAFIRAKREAMPPVETAGRRRTPGLRREEAASRCGLSATLYTWLEQGRDISLTARTLALLADGLDLTLAERAYLFELGQRHDPESPPPPPIPAPVPEIVLKSLSAIQTPAYLLDSSFTARGWNQPAISLFTPWHESREPNLLRFVFLIPAARTFICDWEQSARRLVAEFRAETGHTQNNPNQLHLLDQLRQESREFLALWNARDVQAKKGGERSFQHPEKGVLRYTQLNFLYEGQERHRLIMLHTSAQPGN